MAGKELVIGGQRFSPDMSPEDIATVLNAQSSGSIKGTMPSVPMAASHAPAPPMAFGSGGGQVPPTDPLTGRQQMPGKTMTGAESAAYAGDMVARGLPIAGAAGLAMAGAPVTLGGAALLGLAGGAGGEAYGQILRALTGAKTPETTADMVLKIGRAGAEGAFQEALPVALPKAFSSVKQLSSNAMEKLLVASMSKSEAGKGALRQIESANYDAIRQAIGTNAPDINLSGWYNKLLDATSGYRNNPAVKKILANAEDRIGLNLSDYGSPRAKIALDDALDFQGSFTRQAWKQIESETEASLPANVKTALERVSGELRSTVKGALPTPALQEAFEAAKAANYAGATHDTGVNLASFATKTLIRKAGYGLAGGYAGYREGGLTGAVAGAAGGVALEKLEQKAAPWLYERMISDPRSKRIMVEAIKAADAGNIGLARTLTQQATEKAGAAPLLRNFYRDMAVGAAMQASHGQPEAPTP